MTQPTSAAHQYTSSRGVQVEHVAVRRAHAGQVPARRVQDALRLRRRAGGVEDVQRVLGVHRLGRTVLLARPRRSRRRTRHAPSRICALGALRAHDDDVLQRVEVAHHLVHRGLDRRDPALARRAIDGDQRLRIARTPSARGPPPRRTRRTRRCAARRSAHTRASRRRPRGSSAGRSPRRRPCRSRGPSARSRTARPSRAARRS